MRNIFTFITLLISITIYSQPGVGPAPYCMPAYSNTPCNQPNPSNTAGNSVNDFIDSFNTTGGTFNIVNNNTGCNSQLFSGVTQNYFFVGCPIYLRTLPNQVITCNFRSGITYDQGFAVFIDWNNNGVFNLPGELVCSTPVVTAATWVSAAFTVPAAQPNGTYRMRVRCAFFTTGSLIDPCTSFSFGETEDYRIIVGAAGTCVVLPIELTSFDAVYENGESNISWTTSSEINSDYFTIERSYDNNNFELISKVIASGNSNQIKYYSTTDKDVKSGIVYYRLKQYDKYSSIEKLSKTITLYVNDKNRFDIYPNPANTEITIILPKTSKNISFDIFDISGNKVLSNITNKTIDISNIQTGTYFIRIVDESGEVMKRILIKQ